MYTRLVAVLGAAAGLAVAEAGVDRLVLGHDLVGVQVEPVQAALPGLLLGELQQARGRGRRPGRTGARRRSRRAGGRRAR